MEEKNETVTENKSEKKEVVYTKNEKYGQDEINKLVKYTIWRKRLEMK